MPIFVFLVTLILAQAVAAEEWTPRFHINNLGKLKKQATVDLALQIDDLERICGLTEQQKKKLTVAVKGVLQKRFGNENDDQREQVDHHHDDHDHEHLHIQLNGKANQLIRLAVQAAPQPIAVPANPIEKEPADAPADKVVDEEPAQAAELEPAAPQENPIAEEPKIAVLALPANANWAVVDRALHVAEQPPIQDDPLWKKTLDRVLTDEQEKLYQAEQQRRKDAQDQARLATGVAEAAKRFALSAPQQQKLMKLCQGYLKTNPQQAANCANVSVMVQSIDEHLLRDFLSPAQRVAWSELKKQSARQVQVAPAWNNIDLPALPAPAIR